MEMNLFVLDPDVEREKVAWIADSRLDFVWDLRIFEPHMQYSGLESSTQCSMKQKPSPIGQSELQNHPTAHRHTIVH